MTTNTTRDAAKHAFIGALLVAQNTNVLRAPRVFVELENVRVWSPSLSTDLRSFIIVPWKSKFLIFADFPEMLERNYSDPGRHAARAVRTVDTPTQAYNFCSGNRFFATAIDIGSADMQEDQWWTVWKVDSSVFASKNERRHAARHVAASVIQAHRKRQQAQRFYNMEKSLRPGGSGYLQAKNRFEFEQLEQSLRPGGAGYDAARRNFNKKRKQRN